jgi:surface protein
MGDTQTLVDAQENIWDIYKSSSIWNYLFENVTDLLEVVAANTAGVTSMYSTFAGCTSLRTVPQFSTDSVTNMGRMFAECTSLVTVPQFSTGSVTNMYGTFAVCTSLRTVPQFSTNSVTSMNAMFSRCTSLRTVPQFSTDSVTDMYGMLSGCTAVESGALALYQQASTQMNPPTSYNLCFIDCGRDAPASAPIHAEMQQIPSSWGGLGA